MTKKHISHCYRLTELPYRMLRYLFTVMLIVFISSNHSLMLLLLLVWHLAKRMASKSPDD